MGFLSSFLSLVISILQYVQETGIGYVVGFGKSGDDNVVQITDGITSGKYGISTATYFYSKQTNIDLDLFGEEVIYSYKECVSFGCTNNKPIILEIKKK